MTEPGAHPANDTSAENDGHPDDSAFDGVSFVVDHPGGTAVLFGVIGAMIAVDVVGDVVAGTGLGHVALEATVVLLATVGLTRMILSWRRSIVLAREQRVRFQRDLSSARADAERWRSEARSLIGGLGEAIDHQLAGWSLTPSEKEIALLLLKGLSLREIASVRDTSERTVRQQSLAIYRKSGLGGRAELAAFFLEDLLAPRPS